MTAVDMQKVERLFAELRVIQDEFNKTFGVSDIYTNSRVFEILIANYFDHVLIPAVAGGRDAKDKYGNEYEYKHYKESSTNHTWTFNDFSDSTIRNLKSTKAVIFAHINDNLMPPVFDWYYYIEGQIISEFLAIRTKAIQNKRKMINVSPHQLERFLSVPKSLVKSIAKGKYDKFIIRIFEVITELKKELGVSDLDILTSNKLWEVLIAINLGHTVLTNKSEFDAIDADGNKYEYKVSKAHSWAFEDITPEVLSKFTRIKSVFLATINKQNMEITELWEADPIRIKELLEAKLNKKRISHENKGGLRRLQVSIGIKDLKAIGARQLL
ncbi:MAG: hypothetical protein ACP5U0_09145 [Caldisphaera sp.]